MEPLISIVDAGPTLALALALAPPTVALALLDVCSHLQKSEESKNGSEVPRSGRRGRGGGNQRGRRERGRGNSPEIAEGAPPCRRAAARRRRRRSCGCLVGRGACVRSRVRVFGVEGG